jgi:hypothetical protein
MTAGIQKKIVRVHVSVLEQNTCARYLFRPSVPVSTGGLILDLVWHTEQIKVATG